MANISILSIVKNFGPEDIRVSLYDSIVSKTNKVATLEEVFQVIRTGKGIKEEIENLRNEKNKLFADALKKQLPAITPSGTFGKSRKLEDLIEHSGILSLDFDYVENIAAVLEKLRGDPWCYAVFLSPSGKGIKVLVRINADKSTHGQFFSSMSDYFLINYEVHADKGCKDVTRLMFLSWDPNLHVNEASKVRQLKDNYEQTLNSCIQTLGIKDLFVLSNRNNYIFKLASMCCRKGVPNEFIERELIEKFEQPDFSQKEILTTVKSAYQNPGNVSDMSQSSDQSESLSVLARVESYINKKYDIRFNEVSTKIEWKKKVSDVYAELNENSLYRELQHANLNISISKLASLMQSDFVTTYNPFEDYFNSVGDWNPDQEPDYILELCKYVPAVDEERFRRHFKKMLVRSIACALDDRVFNKQVFVLVYDVQNSGKSTFCRWLCPPKLKDYIAENISTDKDSLITLATNLFVNMDELSTLNRAEINSLKSFISKDRINVRLPFAKKATVMPRRANFIGSTNRDEFLTDETGSVRWLCFPLKAIIDFSYRNNINIDDIWRQAYSLYKRGFEYQLTAEEILENERVNDAFQILSIEQQLIPKMFAPSTKEKGGVFYTATDIHLNLAGKFPEAKTNIHSIGRALKRLGFQKISQYSEEKGYTEKGYFVKLVTNSIT